jgi:hypothetical protein
VFAAFVTLIGLLPQSGLTVFAAEVVNENGIISPAPALTTDWSDILDTKFYINMICDTQRDVPDATRNDPIQAGELYVLKSFTYPVIDVSYGNMQQYEAENPYGYYKIVRPPYFDETAKEYHLNFYSAEDEFLITVSERFVIGNLFNEGVFGNGKENDIGYFLFNDPNKYERREADGNPSYDYEFNVTASYVFDGNGNGKASGIMLITPQGFNQTLAVDYDAQPPLITGQPGSVICEQGRGDDLLEVDAQSTDNGALTYQWYSSTTQSNVSGSAISGETDDVFTPPTSAVGINYYYCEITNTNTAATRNTTATVKSNAVKIDVRATLPTKPVNPDVGDPNANGDALGLIKAADNSAQLTPTIDSTTLGDIFTADYSETPGENEQNVFNSDDAELIQDENGFVVITVIVEQKTDELIAPEIKLLAEYSEADEVLPLDISLMKSLFDDSGRPLADDKIDNAQTAQLLKITIKLPPELQGKLNYKLIRKHGSDITTLTTAETDPSKERIEVSGDTLIIYAKKFSDYVLVADNPPVAAPPEGDTAAMVNSESTANYPPIAVTMPENAAAAAVSETPKITLADFIVNDKIIRRADILNAGGSVNADRTLKNLETVYKKAGGNTKAITIVLHKAEFISYPTFDRIAAFAKKKNIDIYICARFMLGGRTARLIVNAKAYEKTDKSLNIAQAFSKTTRFGMTLKTGIITIFLK